MKKRLILIAAEAVFMLSGCSAGETQNARGASGTQSAGAIRGLYKK